MYEIELSSELYLTENIQEKFKTSISINPTLKLEIKEIYKRNLLNIGKTKLSFFNYKYIEKFNQIARNNTNKNDLKELSEIFINFMNVYFKEIDNSLKIRNEVDLNKLDFILSLSSLMLDDAIENEDIELMYGSFFQLKDRIERKNLFEYSNKEKMNITYSDSISCSKFNEIDIKL